MEGIAIIGMSGRFPGAPTLARFWQNLAKGVHSVSTLRDEDLLAAGVPQEVLRDPSYVRARGVLDHPEMFEPSFFGLQPREAALLDPQHRLFLTCAYEALEDAACDPARSEGPIGVYGGSSLNTYLLANLCRDRAFIETFTRNFQAAGYEILLGNDKDYLATTVSHRLGLKGPSLSIQSACSTSLVAVVTACHALASWQCDVALAGGVSVSFPQARGYLYDEGGIMSRDGLCRPFDADATGTVFGAGVGVVVLKRLEDALAQGDPIRAVIRGFAVNNDGGGKMSYMAPSAEGQSEVIAMAHALAGFPADTITYVETHGTGTPVGDPIEVEGLTRAFRATTSASGFCAIGSLKGNIGHLEAAAGVAGLIKTALMLEHRTLVPTLHFTAPNPRIDFDATPFYVQATLDEWKASGSPLRAGVSAFGVGGTNAHVVLEEPPPSRVSRAAESPADACVRPSLLVLSARTPSALEACSSRLAEHLEKHPDVAIPDVARTLQVGRRALACRRVVRCHSREEAVERLRQSSAPQGAGGSRPTVAFLFPGQGSQHANMGRALYEGEPVYRDQVDRCAELLAPHLGLDLRSLLFPDGTTRAVAEADAVLKQTALTQPALFVTELAHAQLLMSWGITPVAMLGHSVGEYVAATLSGVFTLEDALELVATRGRCMQDLPSGAMLAVRAEERDILPLLDPSLSIAAINHPRACVVSGPHDAVQHLQETLGERGVSCRPLATSHAFHSPMMDPVKTPFLRVVSRIPRRSPGVPYVSNVTGAWITEAQVQDDTYWFQHLRQAVRFSDGLATLFEDPRVVLVEAGPGHALSNLARQHPARRPQHAVISCASSDEPDADRMDVVGALWAAGLDLDWRQVTGTASGPRVSLPTYPFEEQPCWIAPPAPVGSEAREASAPVEAARPVPTPPGSSAAPTREPHLAELCDVLAGLTGWDASAIDPGVPFFEMGYDSLLLAQVVTEIRSRFGLRISFRQLLEDLPTPHAVARYVEEQVGAVPVPSPAPGVAAPAEASVLPLTEGQHEIWLACQRSGAASLAYNEACSLELEGPLDRVALEAAVRDLFETHEALRLAIDPDGEQQRVEPAVSVTMGFTDFADLPADRREAAVEALQREETTRAFDLVRGPLARLHLARLAPDRFVLMVTAHHIACDGWSFDILLSDLGLLYDARVRGRKALLARHQFHEYVAWDEMRRVTDEARDEEAWWLRQFELPPPPLDLPGDHPRPTTRTWRGGSRQQALGPELSARLREVAAARGCTLFTLLMASWQAWLHRVSGQDDLVAGFPVAGQMTSGLENVVGHCANLLPLRARLEAERPFSAFVTQVRTAVLDAFEHPFTSFGALVRQVPIPRDPARVPLVSVLLNVDAARFEPVFPGLRVRPRYHPRAWYNFDLGLNVVERPGDLLLDLYFNADLFSEESAERLLSSWHRLLEGIVGDPHQEIGRLPLIPQADWQRLLASSAPTPEPRRGLPALFEDAVTQHPEAPALSRCDDPRPVSYAELDRRANRLARYLLANGLAQADPVAVLLDDPAEQVVSALAVLKAGGAYLPLDPDHPSERLATLLSDARPPLVVSRRAHAATLASLAPWARTIRLDDEASRIEQESAGSLACYPSLDAPAYIIYTSGSTGRPKGVVVAHRALASFLEAMRREAWITAGDRVAALAAFTFDVHVVDRWLPLVVGAEVVLFPRAVVVDGVQLAQALRDAPVRAFSATPTLFRLLLDAGWTGHPDLAVHAAGEILPPELATRIKSRVGSLWNCYGPTETTVYATLHRFETEDDPVPIGRSLGNTRLYIVDCHGQPVLPGVPGELWIGGDGVATGYLNRPDLEAERFVPNPFASLERTLGLPPSPRLYRSGDLVRMRPDGSLEFLGRLDDQVKLRGFRIEPGEIEAHLEKHPSVRQAVVVLREDGALGPRLVAFTTGRGPAPEPASLREHLRPLLPDYMIPSTFHFLDDFPRGASGKTDRRALATMPLEAPLPSEQPDSGPTSPMERIVARLWCEVLGTTSVGREADFFEMGGHSLLAMRVVSRLGAILGVGIGAQAIFENPTLAALAAVVETQLMATPGGRQVAAVLETLDTLSRDEAEALLTQIFQVA